MALTAQVLNQITNNVMRKTTTTVINRLNEIVAEYNKLSANNFKSKVEERKFNEISEEIELLSVQFGDTFDINLSHKKIVIDREKEEYKIKLEEDFKAKLEIEKEKLSRTIEFQQLAIAGMFQKIKRDTSLSHLAIMDTINDQILSKVSKTLDFIAQNKTEYLKESIISEALKLEGAELDNKGVLILPNDTPNDLREKLSIYNQNIQFELI